MPPQDLIGAGLLGEDRFIQARDGRRLRAMVAGRGEDLVVLEAGLGVSGIYWGPVHAALANHVRVVAYERAGFGASDPADEPRDLPQLADDLAAVVRAVPHRRLVLVGHSWGGPIVRRFVGQYGSDRVHGLVLVDQSDEHALDLYTSRMARWSDALQRPLLVPLARARLLAPMMRAQLAGLPADVLHAALAASSTIEAARATAFESRHVASGLLQLRDDPPELGYVVLTVLSGRQHHGIDRGIRARVVQAHNETAQEHPAASLVAAERSGHMVPVTEPELVAEETLALLQ